MAKQPVMVYLDVEDMEKLEDLSRETGRPLSVIVREAVKRFLKQS
jgi:predicted DNA-binding protein